MYLKRVSLTPQYVWRKPPKGPPPYIWRKPPKGLPQGISARYQEAWAAATLDPGWETRGMTEHQFDAPPLTPALLLVLSRPGKERRQIQVNRRPYLG